MSLGPAIEWMLRHPGQELTGSDSALYRYSFGLFQVKLRDHWYNFTVGPLALNVTFRAKDS